MPRPTLAVVRRGEQGIDDGSVDVVIFANESRSISMPNVCSRQRPFCVGDCSLDAAETGGRPIKSKYDRRNSKRGETGSAGVGPADSSFV